ncbi:MAG TPA: hypothetical protein VF331_14355 [Polyangiales bacterium]
MPLIASAELLVAVPVETAFRHFIDFSAWDLWMPKGFRPIVGPSRPLREGDQLKMAIGPGPGLPSTLRVIRLRPQREICWGGGVPGVLVGEHSFFFAEEGGQTRMRSEEPFSGLLARGPLAALIEREATKTGERTLRSFADYLAKLR